MPTTAPIQAAIYVKEAAGYPDGENSEELQSSECEDFCIAQGFEPDFGSRPLTPRRRPNAQLPII